MGPVGDNLITTAVENVEVGWGVEIFKSDTSLGWVRSATSATSWVPEGMEIATKTEHI